MKLETNRKSPVKTIKKPLCSLQGSASTWWIHEVQQCLASISKCKAVQDSKCTTASYSPVELQDTSRPAKLSLVTFTSLCKLPKFQNNVLKWCNFKWWQLVLWSMSSLTVSCQQLQLEIPLLHKVLYIHNIIISDTRHLESSYNGDSPEDLSGHNVKHI